MVSKVGIWMIDSVKKPIEDDNDELKSCTEKR